MTGTDGKQYQIGWVGVANGTYLVTVVRVWGWAPTPPKL